MESRQNPGGSVAVKALATVAVISVFLGLGEPSSGRNSKSRAIHTAAHRDGTLTRATELNSFSTSGANVWRGTTSTVRYETRWVLACEGNSVDSGDEVSACGYATAACQRRGEPGPLTYQWRRQVAPTVGSWQQVGSTCFPERVPRPMRPALTMESVRSAFARTPFKRPVLVVQPPGGLTLVNLPTFFEASYPSPGYGPGHVHTVTLLGRSVRIGVSSVEYRWVFGDGTPVLATASAGGSWPNGDVQHVYTRAGRYSVQVKAVYRGRYSVDGGPWLPVDSAVTLAAPPVTLTVATAHNHLVADG